MSEIPKEYEENEFEMDFEREVRDDIGSCYQLLINKLITDKKLKNKLKDTPLSICGKISETSCFDPFTDTIHINNDDINNGITYFEETGHFLRILIEKEKGLWDDDFNRYEYSAVNEFFGRLSETIGRLSVDQKTYKRLFENNEERNWKDAEKIKQNIEKFKEEINELKNFKNKTDEIEKSFLIINNFFREKLIYLKQMVENIDNEYSLEKIESCITEIKQEESHIADQFVKVAASCDEIYFDDKLAQKSIDISKAYRLISEGLINFSKRSNTNITNIKSYIEIIKLEIENQEDKLSDFIKDNPPTKRIAEKERKLYSNIGHTLGYLGAELWIDEEMKTSDQETVIKKIGELFQKSNREILENYIIPTVDNWLNRELKIKETLEDWRNAFK